MNDNLATLLDRKAGDRAVHVAGYPAISGKQPHLFSRPNL